MSTSRRSLVRRPPPARRAGLVLLLLGLLPAAAQSPCAGGSSDNTFDLIWSWFHRQTGPETFEPDGADAFGFEASATWVEGDQPYRMALTVPVQPSRTEEWFTGVHTFVAADERGLLEEYPLGAYRIEVEDFDGNLAVRTATVPASAEPPVPRLLNYAEAQAVDPTRDFTLRFAPFAGTLATRFTTVTVLERGAAGLPVVSFPTVADCGRLPVLEEALTVPAGRLRPGTTYDVHVHHSAQLGPLGTLGSRTWNAGLLKATVVELRTTTGGGGGGGASGAGPARFRELWSAPPEVENEHPGSLVLDPVTGTLIVATERTCFALNPDGTGYRKLHDVGLGPVRLWSGRDGWVYGTAARGSVGSGLQGGSGFVLRSDGTEFREWAVFPPESDTGSQSPRTPVGPLSRGPGGEWYGTSSAGGEFRTGTLFRASPDGKEVRVVWSFKLGLLGGQGAQPRGTILASDGFLYGVTAEGGPNSNGTLFRVATNGTQYRVLHGFPVTFQFPRFVGDGDPGEVIEGSDGVLYGACAKGTADEPGMLYRIQRDGTGFRVLHRFARRNLQRASVIALTEGEDGRLYGIHSDEGEAGKGAVFRIERDGSGYLALHSFGIESRDGRLPEAPLVRGAGGVFYGTTREGGLHQTGTVFAISTSPLGPLRGSARATGFWGPEPRRPGRVSKSSGARRSPGVRGPPSPTSPSTPPSRTSSGTRTSPRVPGSTGPGCDRGRTPATDGLTMGGGSDCVAPPGGRALRCATCTLRIRGSFV